MRKALAVLAFVVGAAGCGEIDFHAARTEKVSMRLGRVNSSCSSSSATVGTNSDGSQTSFVHRMSGNTCVLTSEWSGPFLNMADIKREVQKDIGDETNIRDFNVEEVNVALNDVKFKDLSNDATLDLANSAIEFFDGTVNVAGQPVLKASFDTTENGANPDFPHSATHEPSAFVKAIRENLYTGKGIAGTGGAQVRVVGDRLHALQDAVEPALVFEYRIKVDGDRRGAKEQNYNGINY